MDKLDFAFADIIDDVSEKPPDMELYARQQMDSMRKMLKDMPVYACPAPCNRCCHGSILMSYVEYISIIAALRGRGGREKIAELFTSRLGNMAAAGKLLCPFVSEEKNAEHCDIYDHRPLICRVFGTSASPCKEDIAHPHFPAATFYRTYNNLYYLEDGSFIGLPLTETLALYEAPFDIWAIADSGRTMELMAIFEQHGSMRAVICNLPPARFFTILPGGGHLYLDELEPL